MTSAAGNWPVDYASGAESPLLAVIIPVKNPDQARLRRCLASFDALESAAAMQIVLVHTGPLEQSVLREFRRFHCLHVLSCDEPGIYSAYNAGIAAADARFLLFFGHDDIALPEMDEAMKWLAQSEDERILVACGVQVQGVGVRWPSRFRQGIAFRNWAHQGLYYTSALLHPGSYDTRYPLRSDHRLNIALLADRSVRCMRLPLVVCYFSRGGFSSRHIIDEHFDAEQTRIVGTEFGWIWGLAVGALIPLVRVLRRSFRAFASSMCIGRVG